MGSIQVKQGDVRMSEYLMHYGILGQKWGVRRYQNKDGSYTNAGKARRSNKDIYKESKNLSDEELKAKSNRLQAESNYRRLAKEDREASRSDISKSTEDFAKKAVSAIVVTTAFEVGKSVVRTKLQEKMGITKNGSLPTKKPSSIEALEKKDSKWIDKKGNKIANKAFKKSEKEMNAYAKELAKDSRSVNKNGKPSAFYVNNYNRHLAETMNRNVEDTPSPSGKVVRFVAKRGELGVHTALADPGYDMSQVKNGVWAGGRVGYKKDKVKTI